MPLPGLQNDIGICPPTHTHRIGSVVQTCKSYSVPLCPAFGLLDLFFFCGILFSCKCLHRGPSMWRENFPVVAWRVFLWLCSWDSSECKPQCLHCDLGQGCLLILMALASAAPRTSECNGHAPHACDLAEICHKAGDDCFLEEGRSGAVSRHMLKWYQVKKRIRVSMVAWPLTRGPHWNHWGKSHRTCFGDQ